MQPPIFELLDQAALVEQSLHYVLLAAGAVAFLSFLWVPRAWAQGETRSRRFATTVKRHNVLFTLMLLFLAYYSDAFVYPYFAKEACAFAGVRALDWSSDESVHSRMVGLRRQTPPYNRPDNKRLAGGDMRADVYTGIDEHGRVVGYIVHFGYGGIRAGRHAARLLAGERYTYGCGIDFSKLNFPVQ
jgi:hypothetical protein